MLLTEEDVMSRYMLILAFLLTAVLTQAHAARYVVGLDTTKNVSCTDATTRTDGSPLALSEIALVEIRISNGTDTYPVLFDGGCSAAGTQTFDLTQLTQGTWQQEGLTYDGDGRVSAFSASNPFDYVLSSANPNPPVVTE
jgi:hypothetical protein